VRFGVVGKILMRAGFNGIYLVRCRFRMWGAIDFEVISATEIPKKPGFGRKNQLRTW